MVATELARNHCCGSIWDFCCGWCLKNISQGAGVCVCVCVCVYVCVRALCLMFVLLFLLLLII